MPQSNVIFFYLFAAFFVFVTMRGELPKYLGFLFAAPVGGSNATQTPSSGFTDTLGQVTAAALPAIV